MAPFLFDIDIAQNNISAVSGNVLFIRTVTLWGLFETVC